MAEENNPAEPIDEKTTQDLKLSNEVAKRRIEAREAEQEAADIQKELEEFQRTRVVAAMRRAHPEFDDDVFALCSVSDPVEAAAWADRFAEVANAIIANRVNKVRPKGLSDEEYKAYTTQQLKRVQALRNERRKKQQEEQ